MKFLVIGYLSHQSRPKKYMDFSRVIYARDIAQALSVYRKKLKGVKKLAPITIKQI